MSSHQSESSGSKPKTITARTRLKYFFASSATLLMMLVLTSVSGFLALTISNFTRKGHVAYFPWPLFGDALLPLLLFVPALIFRSRICAVGAIISSFINIFLRVASIILYRETFMPLDFQSVRLLLEHSGHYALQAVLGKFYYLWLVPLIILCGAAGVYICVLVWRTSRRKSKKIPVWWNALFAGLLLLSIASNLFYGVAVVKFDSHDYYTGHLVRPLPFLSVDYANDALHNIIPSGEGGNNILNNNIVGMSAKSLKLLREYKMFPPENHDVSGELTPPPTAIFDKIIIIAIESLDLEYIRAVNPAMPEGITPVLDKLLKDYPSMSNYFTASQPTSWALTALLLSRLDYMQECHNKNKNISLFAIAATQGYYCAYFSPLSGIFGDNRKTYAEIFKPHRQYFLEEWSEKYALSRSCTWGISDPELYNSVLKELKSFPQQRMLAVISTMDSHPPYTASGITEEEKLRFPTPFLQALHTTDRNLGKFLSEVMSDPALYNNRTLIVVTADHSATHGENYLNRPDFTPGRIPLIFITPQKHIFNALKTEKFASSIDLTPTLVPMIGGSVPESFMGRTLFSDKNIALCRMNDNRIFVHSPDFNIEFFTDKIQQDPLKKAFADFIKYHHNQSF